MQIGKRQLLAVLGLSVGAWMTAAAQDYPKGKDLGAVRPQKRKEVPHRKVTTRNLFKVSDGYPNGIAVVPEGIWVAEQKAQGYLGIESACKRGCMAVRLERQEAQDGADGFKQHLGLRVR